VITEKWVGKGGEGGKEERIFFKKAWIFPQNWKYPRITMSVHRA